MILLIDNFDSFTYNLVQCFEGLGFNICVKRNDAITVQECLNLKPDCIVIGPGPGIPSRAGLSNSLISACTGKIPLLGICLGHQGFAEVFGGEVIKANYPMHGKISPIYHKGLGMFKDIPQCFLVTRYHSLIVKRSSLPSCLEVTAETAEGEIMGLRHRDYQMESVQFHPESVLTEWGSQLLQNFLQKLPN
jgi:para-aminobenzoate synthetase component 2